MNLLRKIFDADGSLNIEGRILYAHAMHLSMVDDLPEELIDYVWNNETTRDAIAELYELLDIETIQKNPHPFLRKSFVAIDWNNLDAGLEDILRSALSAQHSPNRKLERRMALSFKASPTALKVENPKKDAVCVNSIRFHFNRVTDKPHWLHLKNAKGQSKGEFEIPANSLQFQIPLTDSQQFPTGLYYWTLLVNGTPITNRLYICTEEEARGMLNG